MAVLGSNGSEYRTQLVMLVVVLVGAATAALAFTGQQFAKEARVSLKQAEAIALKVVRARSPMRSWKRSVEEAVSAIPSTFS